MSVTLLKVANVDIKDELLGDIALMMAARDGHTTTVQLLLDRGANVNPDATRETHTYSVDGLRQRKETSSGITIYLWDEQNVLWEET